MKVKLLVQLLGAVYLFCSPIILFAEESPSYYNGYNYGYSKGMNDEIVVSPSKNSDFNSGADEGYWDAQERLRKEQQEKDNEEWQRQQEKQDEDFQREMEDLDRQTDGLINDVGSNPTPQQDSEMTPEEIKQKENDFINQLEAEDNKASNPSVSRKKEEERREQDRQADTILGGIMGAAVVLILLLIYKIIRKRGK